MIASQLFQNMKSIFFLQFNNDDQVSRVQCVENSDSLLPTLGVCEIALLIFRLPQSVWLEQLPKIYFSKPIRKNVALKLAWLVLCIESLVALLTNCQKVAS